jgi:holo-[acyl-carrier protein] synthase
VIVGIGVDLVDIARVEALVARHGERAVAKLFSDGEAAYARARAQPGRHLASRFAAKEAAFKALALGDGARRISWLDIEVVNERDGRPTLRLHRAAAECARGLGVSGCWITITHGEAVAAATVVLERGAPMDGAGPT